MKTRHATVSFKTVGCRLNQAETAVMRASFEEAGFKTVRFGESCDICVIHGCVVTSKAEEDSLRLVRSIKRRYPDAFVVLAGCAAELAAKESIVSDGRANPQGEPPRLIRRLGPAFVASRLTTAEQARDASPYLSKIPTREHTDADYLAGQKEKFNLPDILSQSGLNFEREKRNISLPPSFNTKRAIIKNTGRLRLPLRILHRTSRAWSKPKQGKPRNH